LLLSSVMRRTRPDLLLPPISLILLLSTSHRHRRPSQQQNLQKLRKSL
jgi:hypothetical protein